MSDLGHAAVAAALFLLSVAAVAAPSSWPALRRTWPW
jgi:hypothetical protein